MKKILAFLLIVTLLLTSIPAMADNVRTSGLYTYEIKGNGTITITNYDLEHSREVDIYIPQMIDGYVVTGIGDEAFKQESFFSIQKVNITLPEGIKSIGKKAFWNLNLISINIPDSLQTIGYGAFSPCRNCQFKISSNHPYFAVINNCLYNKSQKELIACSWERIEIINRIQTIDIPEGILSIGDYALAGLGNSNGIANFSSTGSNIYLHLPSTLKNIGNYALFYSIIDSIKGNVENVKTIGASSFEEAYIDRGQLAFSSLESIGSFAFYEFNTANLFNYNLTIDLGSSLVSIPEHALDYRENNRRGYIRIDTNNISEIGNNNRSLGGFYKNIDDFSPLLTTIPTGLNPNVKELPETVTVIKEKAFSSTVEDFRLGAYLVDIDVEAFPKGSTFIVDAGSYAELWCSENGFAYTIEGQEDDLSWLN